MRIVAFGAAALSFSVLIGCGSSGGSKDPEVITDPYTGSTGLDPVDNPSPAANYPVGPYGVGIGDTAADATFFGFVDFNAAANHDLKPIAFHDLYDPDGSKGHKVIYVSIAAVWCGPCNLETKDLPTIFNDVQSQGAVVFQDLYQGANEQTGDPATQSDLENWNKKYKLPFPTVIDPKGKLDQYFDKNGIPFGLAIDPKTMKILATTNGYGGVSEVENFITSNIQ
jgi:thiol-disulfide isomerase/thioredoxin